LIKKYFSIAIIFFIVSFCDYSFGAEGTRHLLLGGGWTHYGIRDMGISPLYYSGSHFSGNTGFQIQGERSRNMIDISFITGTVEPAINPVFTQSRMKNLKGELNFTHLRNGGSVAGTKAKWFMGGSWNTQFAYYKHNQYTNSAINHFLISSLGVSSMVSYPIVDNRLLMTVRVNVPLVAAIVRPGYAYIKPRGFMNHENSYLESLINSIELSTLNRFSGFSTGFSTEYAFGNNSILLIGYRWEYIGHNDSNTLKLATHGIFFQKIFNF
jgi:hypothetical protein